MSNKGMISELEKLQNKIIYEYHEGNLNHYNYDILHPSRIISDLFYDLLYEQVDYEEIEFYDSLLIGDINGWIRYTDDFILIEDDNIHYTILIKDYVSEQRKKKIAMILNEED